MVFLFVCCRSSLLSFFLLGARTGLVLGWVCTTVRCCFVLGSERVGVAACLFPLQLQLFLLLRCIPPLMPARVPSACNGRALPCLFSRRTACCRLRSRRSISHAHLLLLDNWPLSLCLSLCVSLSPSRSRQVLKGLDLSLFDMCVGERRKIEIPARLAYGRKGSKLFGIPPDDGKVRGYIQGNG